MSRLLGGAGSSEELQEQPGKDVQAEVTERREADTLMGEPGRGLVRLGDRMGQRWRTMCPSQGASWHHEGG